MVKPSTFLAFASLASGCIAAASAQSLNGVQVRGIYNIDGNAIFGAINETTKVGPGVEFQGPNEGFIESADFDGSTLTFRTFLGQATTKGEVTSWWFELPGDRDFKSFTLLSSTYPRPISYRIQDNFVGNNVAIFPIDLFYEDQAVPPGTTLTASLK